MTKFRQAPAIMWEMVQKCSPCNPDLKRCYLMFKLKIKNCYLPRKQLTEQKSGTDI